MSQKCNNITTISVHPFKKKLKVTNDSHIQMVGLVPDVTNHLQVGVILVFCKYLYYCNN